MKLNNLFAKIAAIIMTAAFLTAPATAGSETLFNGTFKGAGGKTASGGYIIFKKGGKTFITLGDKFSLSSVPDPKLAFGNGKYIDGTIFTGKLKKLRGSQTYEIPARLDPASFKQVWIWCEKYSVPLAVAKLDKAS